MTKPAITLSDFGSFHVSGRLVQMTGKPQVSLHLTEALHQFTHDPNGHYAIEGAYVQYMIPANATGAAVLLIHGGGMNGAVWETTPDGRKGWLHLLLEAGHPVYIVDMVERGRAGFCALDDVWPSRPIMRTIEDAWETFRIGTREADGLRAFVGQKYPADHFIHSAYAWSPRWTDTEAAAAAALRKVIQRIGPAHIVAHSSGSGVTAQAMSEFCSGDVLSLCLIEPAGLPKLSQFPEIPVLAVWGDFMEQSPFWISLREMCRTACSNSGIDMDEILLADTGLPGHSHLPMQDIGNEEVLHAILDRHIRPAVPT